MNNENLLTETPTEPEDISAAPKASDNGTEDESAPAAKRKKLPREIREFIIRITATVVVVWVTLTFLFGIYICHSDTCYPMVKDGDLCITWRPDTPAQGDLIVYRHNGTICFGRVAALPGDRVELNDGGVWVNGYVALTSPGSDASLGAVKTKFPLTVPEKSVFVLSDNSSDPNDSRLYGAIPLSDCCGSVVFLMRRRGF